VKKFENISEEEDDHVDIKTFKVSSLCVHLLSQWQFISVESDISRSGTKSNVIRIAFLKR
jgi:hypothetical protein